MKFKYEVTLSFAGEDRNYAEEVAKCLKTNGVEVFYDKFEEVDLWGKDLFEYFAKIYHNDSRFCVMFSSIHYANKAWTNHERKSAQARALEQPEEYILPVKLDNTEIPGMLPTIHYLDAKKLSPDEICAAILKKLNKQSPFESTLEDKVPDDLLLPKIKRTITDLEKKQFLKTSFSEIMNYFDKGLIKLKAANTHIETDLDKRSDSKFVASIYVEGNLKSQCKIWIDSSIYGSSYSISYLEGIRGIDANNDSTLNDRARIEEDGIEMFFDILATSFFGSFEGAGKIDLKHASGLDVSKYFWGRFILNLNH
ncbi:MAG: toll/interleukin-1 receptor domain-containing protein [Ignavibacteriaceae bacterium]